MCISNTDINQIMYDTMCEKNWNSSKNVQKHANKQLKVLSQYFYTGELS